MSYSNFLLLPIVLTEEPIYNKNYKLNVGLKHFTRMSIYEFEFTANTTKSTETNLYKKVYSGMFDDFVVKSLSLAGLELFQIERDSFSKKCCGVSLETLNLSNNRLQ